MRTAFPALLSGLMAFFIACQLPDDNSQAVSASNRAVLRARQAGVPLSLVHFTDAEQTLASGDYSIAGRQLHQGIIAYRTETGKMRGDAAMQANRAIDRLIRLRKSLREGNPIDGADLHLAIQLALAIEDPGPRIFREQSPSDKRDLFVPVGGH